MGEKTANYTWSIPSMHGLIRSGVDELRLTIASEFKVQLNFTKKHNNQVNLYVLPLTAISEFKFTHEVSLNGGQAQNLFGNGFNGISGGAAVNISHGPEITINCVKPGKWVHCTKIDFVNHSLNCQCSATMVIKLIFRYSDNKPLITNRPFISNSLQDDLELLFTSGKSHDAVIKTNDGKQFKVHKVILTTRCEVLDAAFQHETMEAATGTVESPFDEETMESLLLFLYCHKTPNIDTIAEKLLEAADYYQLNELKNECANKLIEQLSEEKVVEILGLAIRHSCTVLQEGVLNFIKKKNIPKILQSEGWPKNLECEMCVVLKLISERFGSVN